MSVASSIPVIGLVGGVGSGKSSVARWVAERTPVLLLDGDRAGHLVLTQDEVKSLLKSRFGDEIFDENGEVIRQRVASVVFGDSPEAKRNLADLEAIVHPNIRELFLREIEQAGTSGAYKAVLLDAAVLLESGWKEICDAVVFVNRPYELRVPLLKETRNWEEGELQRREASQYSMEKKRSLSDFVVENDTTIEAAGKQLQQLLDKILNDQTIKTNSP